MTWLQLGLALLLGLVCLWLVQQVQREERRFWQRMMQPPTDSFARTEMTLTAQPTETATDLLARRGLAGLGLATAVLAGVSLLVGTASLGPGEVLATLAGQATEAGHAAIVWNLRLPRLLLTLAVGGLLGLAGALLQRATASAFASSDLTGMAAGGGVAIACWVALVQPQLEGQPLLLPLVALLGVVPLALLLLWQLRGQRQGWRLLTGVGLSLLLPLLVAALLVPQFRVNSFVWWGVGSLDRRGWYQWQALLLWLVLVVPVGVFCLVRRTPPLAQVGAAALVTAVTVGVAGPLGYVGWLAPLLTRRFAGAGSSHWLAGSVLAGALLLLAADTCARVLDGVAPSLLLINSYPVGAVLALLGLPLLLCCWRFRQRLGLVGTATAHAKM
ncbi:MAG: iron chelate uptake ABC transporter family permease subunit [Chloroflexaceae bacterium]|nr:iron chelate uptake ABC transporter family permease subunit [Chloroflexaceae bacterium]